MTTSREPLDWNRYPNFSEHEFRCPCGCGRADMDRLFMDKLQSVRTTFEAPMKISSGFRCADYNRRKGYGPEHGLGKAADIQISGHEAWRLLGVAAQRFPRLGVNQRGAHDKRFIHLGIAEPGEVDGFSPWLWSY